MRIGEIYLFIICISVYGGLSGYDSVKPVWLTSNYMRAGNENVISQLTGQAIDPIYTFTFSSALPGVPNLAYGIRRYRGIFFFNLRYFQFYLGADYMGV